jgi:hypothetical protein
MFEWSLSSVRQQEGNEREIGRNSATLLPEKRLGPFLRKTKGLQSSPEEDGVDGPVVGHCYVGHDAAVMESEPL